MVSHDTVRGIRGPGCRQGGEGASGGRRGREEGRGRGRGHFATVTRLAFPLLAAALQCTWRAPRGADRHRSDSRLGPGGIGLPLGWACALSLTLCGLVISAASKLVRLAAGSAGVLWTCLLGLPRPPMPRESVAPAHCVCCAHGWLAGWLAWAPFRFQLAGVQPSRNARCGRDRRTPARRLGVVCCCYLPPNPTSSSRSAPAAPSAR